MYQLSVPQETGMGTHAALNEEGFELVLQMQNSHELQTYCRRIIEDLGLKVVNEDSRASSGVVTFSFFVGM